MNLGLSDHLKTAFPNVTPEVRPLVINKPIADPQWLAGFASAEGCFFIGIHKSSTIKVGVNVQLEFQVTQHKRDEFLIKSIIEYLNCGNALQSKNVFRYRVSKFSDRLPLGDDPREGDLTDKIIPFFKKYPILGIKLKDFMDFCTVVNEK
uniref:LAGLIDADG endonuclease n=1 Tax=Juglanconis sp. TaxID=2041886 RepID=A0A291LIF4_9PEZI|nr:LAGLIDADG endonuclease [Juglanconis sp.]